MRLPLYVFRFIYCIEQNDLVQVKEYLKGQITPEQDLPDNTPQTEAGTLVKIPDKWLIQTPSYVEDGKEVVSSKQIATVNAVSVGNGKIVPVPIGFYYVGGTLNSGVVISDNEADRNKFAGVENVPSGLKLNANGDIEHEIVGNQFVWIPCGTGEYVKTNWGQGSVTNKSNSYWDTTVD